MERAFLRSERVVPEEAEGGPPPPPPAAAAPPGGDEPGGALMVTETWMLILSEGSTTDSEFGLDGVDEEEPDPVSS